MGLLRTIVLIIVFYYVFRFVARYVFPFVFKSYVNKMQRDMNKQQQSRKKEGEISIEYDPRDKKKSNGHVGEYVDFEEVD